MPEKPFGLPLVPENMKRIFTAILAASVVACLVGCSSDEVSKDEEKKMSEGFKGGLDMNKATAEEKANFDKWMKSQGNTPGAAPSKPDEKK